MENILYGVVDVSTNGGRDWRVIARVVRPAASVAARPGAATGRVAVSGDRGIAIGVGPGRCIRVLPDSPAARKDRAAILVTSERGEGPFSVLRPQALDVVEREIRGVSVAMTSDYLPEDGDLLRIYVSAVSLPAGKLDAAAAALAEQHAAAALRRLAAAGGRPIDGMLTVTVKVPPAPGKKLFVVMSVDSGHTAILSTPPYQIRWDTRTWSNGEHVIEAKTEDAHGVVLHRKRELVYVRNGT